MSKEGKNWLARHKILSVILALIIVVIIGTALSDNNTSTVNNTPAKTNHASTSTNTPAKPAVAHVGSTLNVGGSKGLAITLQQVVDPASGSDQYTTADAGKRFVAVKLQIQNNGSASYSDDANNNVTLIGSDNQSYTSDFNSVSECTNFSNGQYTLAAGESSTGCVVFQVPNGVNPAKVQFQTISGFNSSTAEWLVP